MAIGRTEQKAQPSVTPEQEIAWVAGLFEGEGNIGWGRRGGLTLRVQMTDEDVVRRLHATVVVGTVTGPYWDGDQRHKESWRWAVSGPGARELAERLLPFMGARRSARLQEGLERWRRSDPGMRKCSWCGSEFSVDRSAATYHRFCSRNCKSQAGLKRLRDATRMPIPGQTRL